MIKATNHSLKGQRLEFDLTGADSGIVNAFRRTIISSIPVMAIEKVTFLNNTSILNDENLAHRFGLIPLTTDLKTYVPKGECVCKGKGCARCTATLTLDVTGPATVYSGDFKGSDESVKPAYDKIPLVKLLADQKIKAEAEAIMGYGQEHVKWQAGISTYKKSDDGSFRVVVESYGQLPVDELTKKGFEVVGEKIQQLKDKIK